VAGVAAYLGFSTIASRVTGAAASGGHVAAHHFALQVILH